MCLQNNAFYIITILFVVASNYLFPAKYLLNKKISYYDLHALPFEEYSFLHRLESS